MAWLDDRIWAHPKIAKLTPSAFQVYVFGIAYSSGFGLYGHLEPEHLRKIGATNRVRAELVAAALWISKSSGGIEIHDWDEHNSKRDDILHNRREKDRERKRLARLENADSEGSRPRNVRGNVRGKSADKSVEKSADETRTPPAGARRPRAGAPPMTSDEVTEEQQQQGPTTPAPDTAAAGLQRLKAAGWANGQLDAARTDLPRALALLDHCQTDPTATNPAGLAWTKYQRGDQAPTPPETIAPGATGTRSTTTRNPHECPACFSTFRTAKRLAEHIADLHAIPTRTPPPAEISSLLGRATPTSVDDEPGPADDEPGPAAA